MFICYNKDMKVILYMASSINGVIARADDDTSFVSKVDWEGFKAIAERTGNLVLGRRTYELMAESGELERFANQKILVVTNNQEFEKRHPDHMVAHLPQEAIIQLESAGMKEVLVAGGGGMNASFVEENLLDEIYLDIEPWIIGKGVRLFGEGYFESRLKLLESRQVGPDTIQLHYQVNK